MDLRFVLSFVFVATAAVSAQHDHHDHDEHRVNVAVYYESLCDDSRKFFTQQLYPSLQTDLANFINLTLVPYGKTTQSYVGDEYNFTCHHGPAECEGNKIQSCALRIIRDNQNTKGFNKQAVSFINCLMDKTTRNGDTANFPTQECAQMNHINDIQNVLSCSQHKDASNYLAYNGGLTNKVQKPLKSVPTIIFNDQYKEDDSRMAQSSFVQVLCRYIDTHKPDTCMKNAGNGLTLSLTFILLSTMFRYLF